MTNREDIIGLIVLPDRNDTIDITRVVYGMYSGLQESIYEWGMDPSGVIVYDCNGGRLHMDGLYRQIVSVLANGVSG